MKKTMIAFAMALTFTATATFAAAGTTPVPQPVASQFVQDFSYVDGVKWEKTGDAYKASFLLDGVPVFAFYSGDGDFMGIANRLTEDRLPARLRSELAKNYSAFNVTELYGFSIQGSPGYLLTLQKDGHSLTLKTDKGGNWETYKGKMRLQ